MAAYEFHTLANAFPLMSDLEFQALKQDIAENGQREPIVLFQGKILDGRNRYRACCELKIDPITETFKGTIDDAREFSTSENLLRRHLSKSQKAMFLVLGGYLTPPAPKGRRRKFNRGDQSPRELGKKYGVNHMTLYKAADIAQQDEALAKRVLDGDLSVGAAEIELRKKAGRRGAEGSRTRNVLPTNPNVPQHLTRVFQSIENLESVEFALKEAKRSLRLAAESSVFEDSDLREIRAALNAISVTIKRNKPQSVCKECKGSGCANCAKRGWLPEKMP